MGMEEKAGADSAGGSDAEIRAAELLLLANLDAVDRAVAFVARRFLLPKHEADDLAGAVRLRLVENGYEILRRFEGRSSLPTYLAVVVHRIFVDERNRRWGRWRPSAEARRRGGVTMELEALRNREGMTFEEAFQRLRGSDATAEAREELRVLWARLPALPRPREVGDEELRERPSDRPGADERIVARDEGALALETRRALASALASLEPGDRLVLRLRFEEGLRVSEIARVQGLDQRRLYRRIESALALLRRTLEREGIGGRDVAALLEGGLSEADAPPSERVTS